MSIYLHFNKSLLHLVYDLHYIGVLFGNDIHNLFCNMHVGNEFIGNVFTALSLHLQW